MRLITGSHVRVPLGLVLSGGGCGRVDLTVRYGIHETANGPWLIDTGYGPRVTTGPRSLALRLYARLLGPRLIPEASPAAVLRADHGLAPEDLTTIIVTHWHADHVAYLRDFPRARIIACGEGWRALEAMSARQALRHGIFRELLPEDLARRLTPIQSFPRVETGTLLGAGFDLTGDRRLVALPMPGHAPGHFGLLDAAAKPPVLYATDVTWTLEALAAGRTPALARFVVCDDRAAARRQEDRVRAFMAEGTVLLCHDREAA
jgi:glyoxylase-like metal-dependent hydrolase (beta-lactamase superfamily II)